MFLSLNKKIIYSILFLFLFTSVIFVTTFYVVYGNKIQEEQLYSIQRNQQYIDLLYRSINMSKSLRTIVSENPNVKIDDSVRKMVSLSEEGQMSELSMRKEQMSKLNESFDNRYRAIRTSLQILGISSILLFAIIILVGYLISRWVLLPINRISAVSEAVSGGNLKLRISNPQKIYFRDELHDLIHTFNLMLDSIENGLLEVKNKEEFLQALIDSIPDGIRVIDKDYNVVVANQSYYNQIGGRKKTLKCYEASQGKSYPCSEHSSLCPLHAILAQKKKNVRVVQQFHKHPDRHLSINAAPLMHSGKAKYIVESIRDLSDDINFSHQQKLSSLGFLSTSIAHEMKNQLGALRMIIERLYDKYYQDKPEEEKKMMEMIHSELVSCIAVPERLLKLTRGSSDEDDDIDCAVCLSDVVSLLDFEAKSKGIAVNLVFPRKKLVVRGNEADFKMVAINLMLNALKAVDSSGQIDIHLAETQKNIVIDFTDTGVGISEQNLNRIFDPFFSDGRDNAHKGSGLGLSIAKTIVEKAGGHITVKSTVGEGSTFSLSFPKIKKLAKS